MRNQPETLRRVTAVFEDHLNRHFIERVPDDEIAADAHYLSQLVVERAEKTTTQVRIVFNASAKSAGRPSLND